MPTSVESRRLDPSLTDFWSRYLEAARDKFSQTAEHITPLNVRLDLYVVPTSDPFTRNRKEDETAKQQKLVPLEEAIRRAKHLVILGEPGSGKSTGLVSIVYKMAQEVLDTPSQRILPLFVELIDFELAEDTTTDGLRKGLLPLLCRRIASTMGIPEDAVTVDFLDRELRKGGFLVLLDGYNEIVHQRGACGKSIHRFMVDYPKVNLVITSRKYGFKSEFDVQTVELVELSLERMPEFIERYVRDGGKTADELIGLMDREQRRLAQNPLVLYMTLAVFLEDRELPLNRALLIDRYVEIRLKRESDRIARVGEKPPETEALLEGLSRLGKHMKGEGLSVTRSTCMRILEDQWTSDFSGEKLLEQALDYGLLTLSGNRVRFWHQSVQEYFCVRFLAMHYHDPQSYLPKFFANHEWWETLSLTAGLLSAADRNEFFETCMETDPYLAAMALNNAREGESILGQRLIVQADKLARNVRLLSFFLSWTTTFWTAIGICVVSSLTIIFEPYGYYFEIFHTIHSRIILPWIPQPKSATYVNLMCLLAIAFPLNRLADWLLFGRLQRYLVALQHLGTERARNALVAIYELCKDSPFVHPSYRALVIRSYIASVNTQEELLENLKCGQFIDYSMVALATIGDDRAASVVAMLLRGNDKPKTARLGLACLEQITERVVTREALQALKEGANAILGNSRASYETRQRAYELLTDKLDQLVRKPRRTWRDYVRWSLDKLPILIAVVGLITMGCIFIAGPPDLTTNLEEVHRGSPLSFLPAWLSFFVLSVLYACLAFWLFWRLNFIGRKWLLNRGWTEDGVSPLLDVEDN